MFTKKSKERKEESLDRELVKWRHGKRWKDQRVKWTDSSPLTYSFLCTKIHFLSSFCNYIFFLLALSLPFWRSTLWFPLSFFMLATLQMMSLEPPFLIFLSLRVNLILLTPSRLLFEYNTFSSENMHKIIIIISRATCVYEYIEMH